MLELRSRKTSEQRIIAVPLGLKPEPGGCAVSSEGGWQGRLSPRVPALWGGDLASNYGMPFALSCMAAGREDEVTSEEVGGGAWKPRLFLAWSLWLFEEPCVSQLCNGDYGRRFTFVFLWEHSCQAIILHPVALQTCLFKSNLLPHN